MSQSPERPVVLLATCAWFPDGEPGHDALDAALEGRGLEARWVVWDDVSVDWAAADLIAVRATWEQIFAGETKLSFRLEHAVMIETVGLAMQSVIEHVYSADGTARGAAAATNIFMRTPSGWRLVCHHASPVTAVVMPQPTGPLH